MNATNTNILMNAGNLMLGGDPAFAPDMPAAALLPQAPQAALPVNFAAAMLVQQQQQLEVAAPLEEAVMTEVQGAAAPLPVQALPLADVKFEEAEVPAEAPTDTLGAMMFNLPAQQAPLPVAQEPAPAPLPEEVAVLPRVVQQPAPQAAPVQAAQAAPVPVETQAHAAVKAAAASPAVKTEASTERAKPQASAAFSAVPAFVSVLSAVEPTTGSATPVLNLPTIKLAGEKATVATADEPSQLLQALGDRIQLQIAARSEQAVIRLEPPQMGRVDIAIARQDSGAIEVRMSASHGEVQRQLQQGSETLRFDLAQRHGGEVSVQVSAAPRESADARGQQQRQPSQQQQQQQAESRQPGRALNTPGEQPATPFALA